MQSEVTHAIHKLIYVLYVNQMGLPDGNECERERTINNVYIRYGIERVKNQREWERIQDFHSMLLGAALKQSDWIFVEFQSKSLFCIKNEDNYLYFLCLY